MVDNYSKKNNSGNDEFGDEPSNLKSTINGFKGNFENIKFLLSSRKNLAIAIGGLSIIVLIGFFLLPSSKSKSKQPEVLAIKEDAVPVPAIIPSVTTSITPVVDEPKPVAKDVEQIAPPSLPTLNIDILDKLNSLSQSGSNYKDAIDTVDVNALKDEEEEEDLVEIKLEEPKVAKNRKIDPDNPPPSIFSGQGGGPMDKTKDKIVSDFIFVDSSVNAEDSTDVPTEGKKIPNLGNVVAQGRMIDAILETAINSGIPGTIRAVISRDVYAEAGRSILIPKGTRLYGSYSTGNLKAGRLIVTWSRILRPDGISVGISSFASDQFGRSGVQGNVDKKYGETITSALLLSSIPLIGTVVAQQATGGRVSDTVTTTGNTVTTTSDPINQATVKFTQDLSNATSKIVQDIIDTTIVVTIDQGTRIKVMVNQDLQLVAYKPLTALNTTITYSSQ